MAKRIETTIRISLWDRACSEHIDENRLKKFILSNQLGAAFIGSEYYEVKSARISGMLVIQFEAKYLSFEEILAFVKSIHDKFSSDIAVILWGDDDDKRCQYFSY